jgi:hypothetical protein
MIIASIISSEQKNLKPSFPLPSVEKKDAGQ